MLSDVEGQSASTVESSTTAVAAAVVPSIDVQAGASKSPLEKRAPSARIRKRPGYLADYEV